MSEDLKDIPTIKEDRKDFTGLLNKVKNFLLDYYVPVYDPREAAIHLTTDEVFNQLKNVVPDEGLFSAADVSLWLHNAGFTFTDYGEMKLEWMMKKA